MNERGSLRRWLQAETGVAGVEFALILPLLCVLLFGFFEVGRMFWTYSVASASARDAARFASRLPMVCAGLSGTDVDRIKRLARTGLVDTGGTPLVKGWTNDATVTVAVTCVSNTGAIYLGRYEDMANVPTVKVTATAPYRTLFTSLLPGISLNGVAVSNTQSWTE